MIDLCIDARMAHLSGIGTYISTLVPLLNQPPFRVILLVQKTGQFWCDQMEQIAFPSPIYSIEEQILFPFKVPRCDLFWSPNYNVPLLPIKAKKKIVTIHDACHLVHGGFFEKSYARIVMKSALYLSNQVITGSEFSKQELGRFFYSWSSKVTVVLNGIDFEKFQKPISSENLFKRRGLPNKFILFVGNLKRHKNLSRLIRAFLQITQPSFQDRALVIVGKREGLRRAETQIQNDRIIYLEDVSNQELPLFYQQAEMFVFPSFYEGFGLPPLEAMSSGCPTIVSNAASLPEVCGDASLYIDPSREEEIAEAMIRLAFDDNLKQELIDKGFQRVKRFRWEDAASIYRKIFQAVHFEGLG